MDWKMEKFQKAHGFLLSIDDTPKNFEMPQLGDEMAAAYTKLVEVGKAVYDMYSSSIVMNESASGQPEYWKDDAKIATAEMEGQFNCLKRIAKYVFGVDATYFVGACKKAD